MIRNVGRSARIEARGSVHEAHGRLLFRAACAAVDVLTGA
jgi:hypothetical protein